MGRSQRRLPICTPASGGPGPRPNSERASELERVLEPAQKICIATAPVSVKTRGLSSPKYFEYKAPIKRNDTHAGKPRSGLALEVCPVTVRVCVVPAGPVGPGRRDRYTSRGNFTTIRKTTYGRPAGSVVSVLCFGLSHLEAARDPARVNIPSEYFKLQVLW